MTKKLFIILSICMMLCGSITGCADNTAHDTAFTNWIDGSAPISALTEYVETVTDDKSEHFLSMANGCFFLIMC